MIFKKIATGGGNPVLDWVAKKILAMVTALQPGS
jgi:hypothetical protein